MTDFIIVGGGSAGCVLANRLSEDSSRSVVLIEAGPRDRNPMIHMPAGYFALMKTGSVDWNLHTVAQRHLNGRTLFWPRGRVLGGSSSVNGMIYIRGDASDYDRWAQLGNRGWSYADVLPYFRKAESWQGGADDIHGGSGPLRTTRYGIQHPLSQAFYNACLQAGYPACPDLNNGHPDGVGPIDSTLADARRQSAATAYLRPVEIRRNLRIISGATVHRVILKNGRAAGVEYSVGGKTETLHSDGEVLLSAGTVNSPILLQHSGIGDPEHLQHIGIPTVVELKGVGENLQDHLALSVKQVSSQANTLLPYVKPLRAALSLARYTAFRNGPAAYHGIEVGAYIKTRPEIVAGDLQFHFMMILYSDHGRKIINQHGFMPTFNISRPESRGRVRIASSDPREKPMIDPNYLASEDDLRVMRDGIRISRDILSQKAFEPYRAQELAPGTDVRSDADLDNYIRQHAESLYHPVGTCKMGSDSMSVVDDQLRVHGVDGLRVIDASVMPTLVSGNTNAPTIMIAERGADLVLGRQILADAD